MTYVRNAHPISCLIESEFIQVKEGRRKRGERVNSSEPKKTLGARTNKPFKMPRSEFEPRRKWSEANVLSIASFLLSIICLDFDRLLVCICF